MDEHQILCRDEIWFQAHNNYAIGIRPSRFKNCRHSYLVRLQASLIFDLTLPLKPYCFMYAITEGFGETTWTHTCLEHPLIASTIRSYMLFS